MPQIVYLPTNDKVDHSDLFFKFKHKNETLGIATIKREELFDEENYENKSINFIKGFFNSGIQFDELSHDYKLDVSDHPRLHTIASYPISAVLTKEYLNKGKFDSPLSCKWHPDLSKWIIHPGMTRARVLHHFLEGDLEVYAFNTHGLVLPTYTRIFNSKKEIADYITQQTNKPATIYLFCSAYFGSLLPDIYLDQPQSKSTNCFIEVAAFYRNTKINANFDLEIFEYEEKEILRTPQREVTVHVDSHDDFTLTRAMMLLPCHANYEGYGISIKTK
jgi:hypothetical protein